MGRSLRDRGKRRPGKQPGEPGATVKLIDDPDERLEYPPSGCSGCGAGLAGEPVLAQRRHQITDIAPAKRCPCCRTVTEGELPAYVRARASYGPETHAQAANLTCGHHMPIWRSTVLLASSSASRSPPGGWPASAARLRPWWKTAGSWAGSGNC